MGPSIFIDGELRHLGIRRFGVQASMGPSIFIDGEGPP